MAGKTFRELLSNRELKFGTFIGEVATSGIGHILANGGLDFAFIDMEHSGFSFETVKRLIRTTSDVGVAGLVRPPSSQYHHVARALDAGAEGVMPPMMTLAQAKEVIHFMKYPPVGGRGVAFGLSHDRYRPGTPLDKIAELNARTCFVALIETLPGLDDVEEIAALDGVDGIFIGHFDLSCSLGIPGGFDQPEFTAAVNRIRDAAHGAGKPVGRMAMTPEESVAFYRDGFDLQVYGGDAWMLQNAYTEALSAVRAQLAEG